MQITSLATASIAYDQSKINASTTPSRQVEPLDVDPNFSVGMSLAESERKDWQRGLNQVEAMNTAGDSFLVTRTEIEKVEKSVEKTRPDIKSADWDFSLKDGKFAVTNSRLKADDIKFLESKLNGDVKLTAAAKSFMKASISGLETTHDNPSYTNQNTYAGRMQNYTFYNVADQINGKLGLKNLMKETADYAGLDRKGSYVMSSSVGDVALMVVASHLTSSDKKIGYEVFPTAAR